ncbi:MULTISPECIES: cupin domain-containing protein [Paenibacillus]|uniref:Cupin n=1 Tax=Paenibacillus borealis TaxID=160799 RepID=A0ABX3GX66_PAEBO|nr:cupin domain-containing protein [Paenibacillus borealis]OMD39639.1 cupin [Paenibacillus borealis]
MESGGYIKKLPQSQVLDLREIIGIEEQQICSLTLVQRPNLAMTLLSLDKGSSIGGHSSPGDALVHILSGQAQITIGSEQFLLQHNESILMPANIPHALQAVEAFQMLLIVVKPEQKVRIGG